ncbi:SET domain-containing protein, putative [Phytophthora infestans T30-4]|uniref:SET domain-containing protein, putative n=1 Tax=Phytophthora infestans (strain T30-4) TaxID=403677 RepID=D0MZY2_PHYIT|nr:SET domain-containing protein, putative [Phytophthora infestans T30-4]XP_002906394.1 SET domain-containing protein, putative [Phytophthora infestans T30-4]EEY65795.1 SET domain-containing protein, putative [Phytophthora infestans T30-4]EEY66897.1 SET domain-containing protein, putative [Phytophthora infestans T30-4]|eukprot:XP_002896615.1 SET domain-containing protein, putative [Phytophthora infestans T30-4]
MQRGRHAELSLASLPGKGISLMADMPIERDTLIAQYVGEVISRAMYREPVNTNEVIDARFIGGIARFANHSCSPNCVVERWEVGGETCCGIFSVTAINKGEEITIKYGRAFVRDQVS